MVTELVRTSIEPWAPHPMAAPRTEREGDDGLMVAANGTRTCVGGWQVRYSGVIPGQAYAVTWAVTYRDVERVRDTLECYTCWADLAPEESGSWGPKWEYLLPEPAAGGPPVAGGSPPVAGGGAMCFARTIVAPEDADALTLRCVFRWACEGYATWGLPRLRAVEPPEARAPVRVAVVTGSLHSRLDETWDVAGNLAFYAALCEAACAADPDLIALPEICLQWQVPGSPLDLAVPAPGPETDVLARIARRHQVRIALPILERHPDVVTNTVLLIDPQGVIDGRYDKVHLAVAGELHSGILPGNSFPVYETEIGRIGCNICMDSSVAESSRMVGLNGADFLVLPIMGDHRANRFTPGTPVFNEGRWQAIMRTRSLDNQLCMVVARNEAWGSCIVDRKGEILAWNEGDRNWIQADVQLDDDYRAANGGCFSEINWMQRRPHLYQRFTDEWNLGSLR
jgi:predicted amidohydrolase